MRIEPGRATCLKPPHGGVASAAIAGRGPAACLGTARDGILGTSQHGGASWHA